MNLQECIACRTAAPRRLFWRFLLPVLLAPVLLWAGPASAQCFTGFPSAPWPGQMSFDPPMPVDNQAVDVVVGPATGDAVTFQVSRQGTQITVSGTITAIGFMPPSGLRRFPLGGLPPGSYDVTLRFLGDGLVPCGVLQRQLIVGAGPAPVPALSGWSMLVLALAMLACAALRTVDYAAWADSQ